MIALDRVRARAGGFSLEDVTFSVPSGAYGVVIGPAGAGKTTLLETIAGVLTATSGTIMLGDRDVTRARPEARRVGMVYQHAYLFPHLTVRENVAYGAADARTAADMAERFGVAPLLDRAVGALSGGERQLVAIARALSRQPDVLLLDEPFSALDPRTRTVARRLLRAVHQEQRFTVLQVTHDFGEAGLLGDVAVVLDGGRVVQQGPPELVFRKPASPYIADFLGAENVYAGEARASGGAAVDWMSAEQGEPEARAMVFTTGSLTFYALGDATPGPAHAVVRAEEVSLSMEPSASSMQNQFSGTVVEIAPGGALSRVTVNADGTPIVAAVTTRSVRELGLAVGSRVVASFKATAVHLC